MKTLFERLSSLNMKYVARVALALVLVAILGVSLWFATPTQALQIDITPPPSGQLGSNHSFTVAVTIETAELLRLSSAHMYIYKSDDRAGYQASLANIPFTGAPKSFTAGETGGGAATVTATTGAGWSSRSAAGYVNWQGTGYTWPVGLGYGYITGTQSTSITFNVNWTSPVNWPAGSYKVEMKLIAVDSKEFIKTSTAFTISTPPSDGGGGGGGAPPSEPPTIIPVASVITSSGQFTQQVTGTSSDGKAQIVIAQGTVGTTADGQALNRITIQKMASPPTPALGTNVLTAAGDVVAPAQNAVVIGISYDFGPDGAQFSQPVTITFTYDQAALQSGVDEANLFVAFWDTARNTWIKVDDFTIDPATNTVTARITHFTQLAVLALNRPASFTVSGLTVTPPEVNTGEKVTVTATVANTGDLSGTYKVTFKVNNQTLQSMDVTLTGQKSQNVTFSTSQTTAGTYTIDINGQAGKFTVKAPPAPTTPPAPAPTPTPTLAPAPAPTPAPTTPTVPASTQTNWWPIIGGILGGVVIISIIVWWLIKRRQE